MLVVSPVTDDIAFDVFAVPAPKKPTYKSPLTFGVTAAVEMLAVVVDLVPTISNGDTVADDGRPPRYPEILATIAPVPECVIVGAPFISNFEEFGDVPLYHA